MYLPSRKRNREERELWDLMKKFNISAEKDRRSRPRSDDSVSKKPRDENFAEKSTGRYFGDWFGNKKCMLTGSTENIIDSHIWPHCKLDALGDYGLASLQVDDIFCHFTNLQSLEMSYCNQSTITDDTFRHLSKLTSLAMDSCDMINDN